MPKAERILWVEPQMSLVTRRYMQEKGLPVRPVKHRLCAQCDAPFIPKHWEPQYTLCQECYGPA